MRKIQQQQILDVLKTIDEAQVNGFYADCQDGAIAIGEYIEGLAGEGTETVTLLEEYLDLLLLACNGKTSVKTLRRQIIKVENSVKIELKPTKIEALFLPYNVSMWDSLESIYLAAKSDPVCDAYVVPIPSYELNPDGTLGQMHYDGEQYPGQIPIINWQDYDIEARQPDVIFIHYAYDDYVNNATIHPIFYSERLRQNCRQLIYVPYYVSGGETIDDYNALLPGVRNAHHVIVESEAIRESYIKFYEQYDKEYDWKGIYGKSHDKFIALGSPKYDKAINSKPEDFTLPEKWAKLLTKPDGTKKKAILFNTHMFKWIEGKKQYFKKLRFIFDTFKNQDDVVLWWRPHPNTELNFRTKSPELLGEYQKLVEEYINDGWGIYDDTPELHRAIATTDAYYGDASSIIALYKAIAKPVMLSDMSVTSSMLRQPLIRLHVTDEYIWFICHYFNTLFRLTGKDHKIELVGHFSEEKSASAFSYPRYIQIIEKKGVLYLTPFAAKEIAIYRIDENIFETIPLKLEEDWQETNFAFVDAVPYNEYIYFIPHTYPSILRLNTETMEIKYITENIESNQDVSEGNQNSIFNGGPLVVGDTLWLVFGYANTIQAFDMEASTSTLYEIGSKEYRFVNITFDGQYYWLNPLSSTNTPIIKWCPQKGIIDEFSELYDIIDDKNDLYFSIYSNDYNWMIPFEWNHVIKQNIHTGEISTSMECKDASSNGFSCRAATIYEDCCFSYNLQNGAISQLDFKTNDLIEVVIDYSPEIENRLNLLIRQYFKTKLDTSLHTPNLIFDENNPGRLIDYISYVTEEVKESTHLDGELVANNKAGVHIYQFTKKELAQ